MHKDIPILNLLHCVRVCLYMWVSSTMSVHMCVYAHVRTCVHVYECIVCESRHKHRRPTHQILCMHICAYTYVCACVYASIHVCVYLCRCVRETDRIRWQTGVTGQASSRRGRTSLQSGHRACLVRRPPACQCVVLLTNTHRHTHTRTYTVVSLFCVFLTVWDIEKHRDRE